MDTVNYIFRAGLWAFAGIQFGRVLVQGGGDLALFCFAALIAFLYNR